MKKDIDYGHFIIDLEHYLEITEISKNRLCKKANIEYTQLQNYCKNKIQRMDLAVMAPICYALNCNLSDIVKYVPPQDRTDY